MPTRQILVKVHIHNAIPLAADDPTLEKFTHVQLEEGPQAAAFCAALKAAGLLIYDQGDVAADWAKVAAKYTRAGEPAHVFAGVSIKPPIKVGVETPT